MARLIPLFRLLLLVVSGGLAACGPLVHTEYRMVPPATESGRVCASYCIANQQNCRQSCGYQEQQCQVANRAQAQYDYRLYIEAKERAGEKIKKSLRDFDYSYRCDSAACAGNCEASYRACHANCGGQVIPQSVCDFNCGP